jgi:hypothetical protein
MKGDLVQFLTKEDEIDSERIALLRNEGAIKVKKKDKVPCVFKTPVQYHANGVMGEKAVAKFIGIENFIPKIDVWKEADIGRNIEVKLVNYISGRLIIKQTDIVERIAILVINLFPKFEIIGWIKISDVKNRYTLECLNDPVGVYLVPQKDLNKDFSVIIKENL